jgi:hypothetical protein
MGHSFIARGSAKRLGMVPRFLVSRLYRDEWDRVQTSRILFILSKLNSLFLSGRSLIH